MVLKTVKNTVKVKQMWSLKMVKTTLKSKNGLKDCKDHCKNQAKVVLKMIKTTVKIKQKKMVKSTLKFKQKWSYRL